MVRRDVEVGDKDFGKLLACPNKEGIAEDRREHLLKVSNLQALADKTLSNFDSEPHGYTWADCESLKLAHHLSIQFVNDTNGWVLLEGTYGTGKTHLAAAIGNALLEKGHIVLFITAPDLLDYLRSTFQANDNEHDDKFERVRSAPVLIIDDLGTENPSGWTKEKLFQILNHRYTHKLPTVITTNVELDTLDPRLRSRLLDEQIIHRARIIAPDFRTSRSSQQDQLMSSVANYENMTFDQFDVSTNLPREHALNLEYAGRAAYTFAQNPNGWLIFIGSYGTGKTHLAAAISHFLENAGVRVMFVTVPDLLDFLRETFSPTSPVTFDRRFQAVRNAPVLVLDDMGTENATSWAKEKLFQIIDFRYVRKLPTVITSASRLESMEPRIATRLTDARLCTTFAITAPNYTERMKRLWISQKKGNG